MNNRVWIRRLSSLLLSLLLGLTLLLPCRALESEEGVLDQEELSALLSPCLEKYGATEENFSLAFTYTGTGESYLINGDRAFYAASLYKLPLCMLYAEKVSLGELSYDSLVKQVPLSTLMERTLVRSNNDTASVLYFASDAPYDHYALAAYSGMEPEDLPQDFSDFYFTARFMLATLQTLYDEPERFPGVIDYMKEASPGAYFRSTLEGEWDVAQKYGQYEGVLHTAGIIYTPTPILLVVMCERMSGQLEAIGELAQLLSDYALTLDERQAQREAQLAQAATPTPAPTPEPTPVPTPSPVPSPTSSPAPSSDGPSARRGEGAAVFLLPCLAAALAIGLLRKRRREKPGEP